MSDVLLEVEDLRTYFRTPAGVARAVDGVSFQVRRGETLAIVGESGSGKSVTALSINRLFPQPPGYVAGGRVVYKGRDLLRLPEFEMRRLRGPEISMIFQEPMTSLNPVFTVGEQVAEVFRLHQGLGRADARRRTAEILDRVGIPQPERRLDEYPHEFSGGMRQRVMIALALACRPGLLIADEPTTAVDVTIQAQILALMRNLQKELGTAILLITHNMGVVAENAHRVAVMYAGRIVEVAERQDLFGDPRHPYTVRLLQSLPTASKRGEALHTIEGQVPRVVDLPAGCRFRERCHKAFEPCSTQDPPLLDVGPGRQAACLLYDGGRPAPGDLRIPVEPRVARPAASPRHELLQVRGLEVHFPIRAGILRRTVGHVRAVDGVDMDIREGETLALVGGSGCGKTTLGKALVQLIRPTGGSVEFEGTDLRSLSRSRLKPYRRRLQIVFQDPFSSLNPRMTVGEILEDGMSAHGIGTDGRDRAKRIASVLDRVGLESSMTARYPHEFSGGQRQRVGIARCLVLEPSFIVCDEATSALDVSVQAQIVNLLRKLQVESNLAYLFITHDLSLVEYLADEVAVMSQGKVIERGPTREVFERPRRAETKALIEALPRIERALTGGPVSGTAGTS